MLVLTRKLNEEIVIAGQIHIQILEVRGNRVRLGITAPEDIGIQRSEISFDAADLENPLSTQTRMPQINRAGRPLRETALVGQL